MTGPVWPDLLTVHVERQDIADGRRGEADRCPIALAIRRTLKLEDDRGVMVYSAKVWVIGDQAVSWHVPTSVSHFIGSFDLGCDVAPFTFAAERAS